jgi:hypothetical protein
MALDDYFSDPSQDCLARLFDAVNSMDLSAAPILTRQEKMVMRFSERKDIFTEKFSHLTRDSQQAWNSSNPGLAAKPSLQHKSTHSGESYSSFEEGILLRHREKDRYQDTRDREGASRPVRADTDSTMVGTTVVPPNDGQNSPSDSSFSLGGSAVWVGDESGLDLTHKDGRGDTSSVLSLSGSNTVTSSSTSRKRRSTDASSSSSQAPSKDQMLRVPTNTMHTFHDPVLRSGMTKDTHFYQTSVAYKDHQLPIKMPLSTFPEEVGDVRVSSILLTAIY